MVALDKEHQASGCSKQLVANTKVVASKLLKQANGNSKKVVAEKNGSCKQVVASSKW